jgi:hypothetical protein
VPRRLGASKSCAVSSLIPSAEAGQNFCYPSNLCYTTYYNHCGGTLRIPYRSSIRTYRISVLVPTPDPALDSLCTSTKMPWIPPLSASDDGRARLEAADSSPLCELSFPGFPQQHQYFTRGPAECICACCSQQQWLSFRSVEGLKAENR